MNTQTLTQQFENLAKGCKDEIGYKNINGKSVLQFCSNNNLCPTCKAKLQSFISVCEDELLFLNSLKEVTIHNQDEDERIIIEKRVSELQNIIRRGKEILK